MGADNPTIPYLLCFNVSRLLSAKLIEKFKQFATALDVGGYSQPRIVKAKKVILSFGGSCMASYFGTVKCLLPTSI